MHIPLSSLLSLLPLLPFSSATLSPRPLSPLSPRGQAYSATALVTKLSAPTTVTSVDGLKLVASITNTGKQDAWVYQEGSVLDETPTESFKVWKRGEGKAKDFGIGFVGVKPMMSRDLPAEAFVLIPAGETREYQHNLAALYDFSSAGSGTYTFIPRTPSIAFYGSTPPTALADLLGIFHAAIPPSSSSKSPSPLSTGPSATIKITGDLSRRHLLSLSKRSTVTCADPARAAFIREALTEGQALASEGVEYLRANSGFGSFGGGAVTRKYFGFFAGGRPRQVLQAVASENDARRTMGCDDPVEACAAGVIAYTLVSTTNIYYCNPFFQEIETSALCDGRSTVATRNIRGGTVLHELTHALSGTDDYGYGQRFATSLANSFGFAAVNNADNYNLFATEVHATTRC